MVLGLNLFILGFEDGLVGVKVEEVKDVEVIFFENYGVENLVGKVVVFIVIVKVVKELKDVEINDELVIKFGVEDLDVLKV